MTAEGEKRNIQGIEAIKKNRKMVGGD